MSKIIQAKLALLNAKVAKDQAWENALIHAKFFGLLALMFWSMTSIGVIGILYSLS